MLRTLFALLTCTVSLTLLAQAAPQPEADTPPAVADLIAQLGSKQFKVREQASATLAAMPTARLALARACKSTDAEVVVRAGIALAGAKRASLPQQLDRLKVAAKNGEPDIVVALLTQYDWPADDNRPWQAYLDCVRTVLEQDVMTVVGLTRHDKSHRTIEQYITQEKPTRYQTLSRPLIFPRDLTEARHAQHFMSRSTYLESHIPMWNSLLAIDTVIGRLDAPNSTVIINGSLSLLGGSGSVFICDGDTEVGSFEDNFLICSGDVRVRLFTALSTILASGNVVSANPQAKFSCDRTNIRAGGRIVHDEASQNKPTLEPHHANPLGKLRFFDSARVGVEKVVKVEAGVRIDTLAAKCKLAEAGLRVGDIVTAIDGVATFTPDSLRRSLRTALVNEYGFVTVERAGRAVVVEVQF